MSKVIYDALSFTSKIHSTADIIELLGIESVTWENVKGAHGYRDRLYWNCISIHYNGSEDMGVWLELTGQGCRAFEDYGHGNYEFLFQEILLNSGDMNLTRLDVAFDDDEGILDMDELCDDTRSGSFVSRFSDWEVIEGSKGQTVNHGSTKSEIFIRIYDKARERGYTDGRHWIRVELQLRRDRALGFIKQPGSIGDKFSGVLGNYLRYVLPDELDSNRWRWPMLSYWAKLLSSAQRIRLYDKPGTEYNMSNLDDFVFQQAGNAISAAVEIYGQDLFFDKIRNRNTAMNPKYQKLINEYKKS